jgi:hypothetical protein
MPYSFSNSWKLSLLVVAVVLAPLLLYYNSGAASLRSRSSAAGSVVNMSSLDLLKDEIPALDLEKVVIQEGYADVEVRICCNGRSSVWGLASHTPHMSGVFTHTIIHSNTVHKAHKHYTVP